MQDQQKADPTSDDPNPKNAPRAQADDAKEANTSLDVAESQVKKDAHAKHDKVQETGEKAKPVPSSKDQAAESQPRIQKKLPGIFSRSKDRSASKAGSNGKTQGPAAE